MKFDNKKVERFKDYLNSLSIADIFGEYDLTIDGRKVSCPFHDESRPSLFVLESETENDKWFCQSCRRGGTIVSFISEYYKMFYKAPNYYKALEQYLSEHKELWEELGFKTLKDFNNSENNEITLNEALEHLTLYKELNSTKLRTNINLLPDKNNYEEVIKYLIKIQTRE